MVVLDETHAQAVLGECLLLEALDEEAAGIPVDGRLDQRQAGDIEPGHVHAARRLPGARRSASTWAR